MRWKFTSPEFLSSIYIGRCILTATVKIKSLQVILLKGKPVVLCESQFLEVGKTREFDHRRRSTHKDLCLFSGSIKDAIFLDHFFGNKSRRPLPRPIGRRPIEGVVDFQFIRMFLGHGFQLLAAQDIFLGYSCFVLSIV